ncbi:hypothetical protein BC828DRAFT_377293 [Blastocladiella britannica]|nr:hypothetical protein BC828DRAFT_377293 [Blastocladiella britannica]
MYTGECAREILARAVHPDPAVAKPAQDACHKYAFGNVACDALCQQCTTQGCIQCKDNDKYEVQSGKCVARVPVSYAPQYFAEKPQYNAVSDAEVVPVVAGNSTADVNYNAAAASVGELSTDAYAAAAGVTPKEAVPSSAVRFVASSALGLVALAASLIL